MHIPRCCQREHMVMRVSPQLSEGAHGDMRPQALSEGARDMHVPGRCQREHMVMRMSPELSEGAHADMRPQVLSGAR